MVESALFSVSIRLRNNLIAQKSHCLIEAFNSFENMFIHKIESSLPKDQWKLYECIISLRTSTIRKCYGNVMVIGFKWKPTDFKPAKPKALIHYACFAAE